MSSEEHPLSKAFSADMTPENLKKARKDVDKQISSNTPKPPQADEDEEPEEDEDEEPEEDEDEEPESDEGDEESEEDDEAEDTEAEDTEEETLPAEADEPVEYVADLNNVADVLVILVGKYSRLVKLLYVCVALLVIGVGLIVKAGFEIDHLQATQASLQREVLAAKDEAKKASDDIKETKDAVKETKDAVKEAAENAPKVVVDADAGTAKIVLPVKKCKGDECDESKKGPKKGPTKKPPSYKPAPPPPAPPTAQTVPLNPKMELEDEDGASF